MTRPAAVDENVRIVRHTRTIDAPVEAIFAVLADPAQHRVIDGSGLIRGLRNESTPRLALGAVFEMRMCQAGGNYRIANEVVEFDEPHLIAWQVHPAGRLRRLRELLVGGHRWRYRLTAEPTGTTVCEEFDYSGSSAPWLIRMLRFPSRNSRAIERTLDRLAEISNASFSSNAARPHDDTTPERPSP